MLARISLRARAVALLPPASLAVHDLRYRLAYGGDAGRQLAHQGHAYLGAVKALVGLLCALVAADLLARLVRAWRQGSEEDHDFGRLALWALAAAALLAVYVGQELFEGAIFAGHPAGLGGVLGGGGWLAVPLSLAAGGLLTLFLAGARAVARALAARTRRGRARRADLPAARRPRAVALSRLAALASAQAGRAPPHPVALTA